MFNDCICFMGLIFGLSVVMAHVYVNPDDFRNRVYYHVYSTVGGLAVGAIANAVYVLSIFLALFGAGLVR